MLKAGWVVAGPGESRESKRWLWRGGQKMVNPLSLLHSVLALYFDDPGTLSCREWERREREKAIKRQREKARKRESEKGDTIEAVES